MDVNVKVGVMDTSKFPYLIHFFIKRTSSRVLWIVKTELSKVILFSLSGKILRCWVLPRTEELLRGLP